MLLKPQHAEFHPGTAWGMDRICWTHHQPIDEALGYCWLCLSREVDPPDDGMGSWWWSEARRSRDGTWLCS